MERAFILEGLHCANCAGKIEREVKTKAGVEKAEINLMASPPSMSVTLNESYKGDIFEELKGIVRKYEPDVIIRDKIEKITNSTEHAFILQGLHCANCAGKIEREVKAKAGVEKAEINLMASPPSMSMTLNKSYKGDIFEELKGIVRKYEPDVIIRDKSEKITTKETSKKRAANWKLLQIIVGAVIFIAAIIPAMPEPAKTVLYFAAYAVLGFDIILLALKNILKGRVFDENFLMTIASAGALIIGEYPEAVAVLLFYSVGEYFQEAAVGRSKKSISALMDIRPDYAFLKTPEGFERVSPESVNVGDVIVVKPGEKIPLDGIIAEGESTLDMKALTGESLPRNVERGGNVLSGSVNLTGALEIEVTKTYGQSTVAKIIDLVENAGSRKAKTENFITVFSRYYTPAVVCLAALLFAVPTLFLGGEWSEWLNRSLVFLVVSCPCALVISIPLSYFAGIGGASKNGVLVKGGNFLDALSRLNTVVFDKTGTLTKGVFKVTEINAANGFDESELLKYAAAAEAMSNHPIALSIREACAEPYESGAVSGYEERSGHGVSAEVSGKKVLAGNKRFLQESGIDISNSDLQSKGTSVFVAVDGVYAGVILIADEVKDDAAGTISGLRSRGVSKVTMLTGDNESIGRGVGEKLGLDEVYAELLPAQKVETLERLCVGNTKKSTVAYVGDGINDAPVLARADVGVAMGGLGSDAAIEAADVVIMTDEPSKLLAAVDLAKATKRIVAQNIIFALGVKGLILALGAFGLAGMWAAVFADVGVAMLVILNAMRILRKKAAPLTAYSKTGLEIRA